MLKSIEDFLTELDEGKELSREKRRRIIAYWMATQSTMTNNEMADRLGCNEKTVREDKKAIREEKFNRLKEDDIKLIIADIIDECEEAVRDLKRSRAKSAIGSASFVTHTKAITDTRFKMTETLQSLGYYPKNVQAMTQNNYVFETRIIGDMPVNMPVGLAEQQKRALLPEPIIDAEFVSTDTPEELAQREKWDNEFDVGSELVSSLMDAPSKRRAEGSDGKKA